jgi:L-asparagine oxygenase
MHTVATTPGTSADPAEPTALSHAPTFAELVLSDPVRAALTARLRRLPALPAGPGQPEDPEGADRLLTLCHQAFAAALPVELLQPLLDFGRHSAAPGVLLVRNLPEEAALPPTPGPDDSAPPGAHVARGVLLGLSALLGEPMGVRTEKAGRLVHDVVPLRSGARTQTNQSSSVFLNFHSDIAYDATGRYDLANPDFLVLNCLRADREGHGATHYADARDLCALLDGPTLTRLRSPLYQLNAPGNYTRAHADGREVLSEPVPLLSGPCEHPQITLSANGVHAMTRGARDALDRLQTACRRVAHAVQPAPGTALLVNNRKGIHARSPFTARYDGRDRWLQRTYVRRELWTIRYRADAARPRVHD